LHKRNFLKITQARRACSALAPVVDCKIHRKENSPILRFVLRSRVPVSPDLPEVHPTIDQNKRPEEKGLLETFSRVYPKNGKHVPGK